MRDLILSLPKLWQPCVLQDKQRVQGRMNTVWFSRGLGLKEDSSKLHRDSSTPKLQLERHRVMPKSYMFYSF